jgi:replicative DNA helicase
MKRREKTTLDIMLEKEREQRKRKRAPADEPPGDPEPSTFEDASNEWPEDQRGEEWEPSGNGQSAKTAREPKKPRFAFRTSSEFLDGDYRQTWLVKGLIVEGQPGIVGGPKKSLKTSLLVELAYALATGSPFLGRFNVPRPLRVGIMSGESGEFTLKETTLRICAARGITAREADVVWEFELPRLADAADLATLRDAVEEAGIKFLLIDPLYLCLLSGMGAAGLQASNLFHMGPLFLGVAKACLQVGCTPLLAHHFKLTRANPYDEPQLEDLAFAGVQEFARQWLLLGRRERFEPGLGIHKLWLSAGGSAGQSGLWALDIDEGVMDSEFRGRKWDVAVHSATDVRRHESIAKEERAKAAKRERDREDESKFLAALDRLDPNREGVSLTKVRDAAGLSGTKANHAFLQLVMDGILEDIPDLEVKIGSGATRKVQGVKRAMGET